MTLVQNTEDHGALYSIRWSRVVLDEAHTIKNSKSQISMAAAALTADCRWCLTGTPIQVTSLFLDEFSYVNCLSVDSFLYLMFSGWEVSLLLLLYALS